MKKILFSASVLVAISFLLGQRNITQLNAFAHVLRSGDVCGISRDEFLSLVISINNVEENFLHLSNTTIEQMWWGATLGLNDSLEEPLSEKKLGDRIIELRALRPHNRLIRGYLRMPGVQDERNAQDFLYFVNNLCEVGLLNKEKNHMNYAIERAHESLNDPYSLYLSSAQRETSGVLSQNREVIQSEITPVLLEELGGNVYLLTINSLEQQNVSKEVHESLDVIGNKCPFPHIIIDLRNNRGGELEITVDVLNNFLSNQTIAHVENRDGILRRIVTQENSEYFDYRSLTLLVNHKTASGAEIIVAALREYGAVVVGNRTYGKGVGQTTVLLPNGGSSTITQFRFYAPSGNSWDGIGIEPDIETEKIHVSLTHEDAHVYPHDGLALLVLDREIAAAHSSLREGRLDLVGCYR